jgi:hypothetical protein
MYKWLFASRISLRGSLLRPDSQAQFHTGANFIEKLKLLRKLYEPTLKIYTDEKTTNPHNGFHSLVMPFDVCPASALGGSQIISPEVNPDKSVTFRVQAPAADSVQITGDSCRPLK